MSSPFILKLKKIKLYVPKLEEVIVMLFFINSFSSIYGLIPLFLENLITIVLGFISIFIVFIKKGISRQKPWLLFVGFYSYIGFQSILFNANSDYVELLWPMGFMAVGLLLLNFKLNYKFILTTTYALLFLCLLWIIQFEDVESIRGLTTSRNGISVRVIMLLSVLIITNFTNKLRLNYNIIFLSVVICFLAIGRSGILTSFLLVIECFLYALYLKNKTKKEKITILSKIIFAILTLSFVISHFMPTLFENVLYNFEFRGLESIRTLIWKDYLYSIKNNLLYFIFGSPITGTVILEEYRYNLHNSVLMLHAKYGIMGILLFLFLTVNSFINIIKYKKYVLLIPFSLILFRMQFDYTNFNGILDFPLIYFLLCPYYNKK